MGALQEQKQTELQHEAREADISPKVRVAIQGHSHASVNLSTLPVMGRNLSDHLASSTGKNIVYIESYNTPHSWAQSATQGMKRMGILRHQTASTMRHLQSDQRNEYASITQKREKPVPTDGEIDARITAIESNYDAASGQYDLNAIVGKGLVPADQLELYFRMKMLDDLSKRFTFTIEYESHDKSDIALIDRLYDQVAVAHDRAKAAALRGDFTAMVAYEASMYIPLRRMTDVREKNVADAIKAEVKTGLRREDGGSVFMIFGGAHAKSLLGRVQGSFKENKAVGWTDYTDYAGNTPSEDAVNNGWKMTDQQIAEGVIHAAITDEMTKYAVKSGVVNTYAYNWDKFNEAALIVIENLGEIGLQGFVEARMIPSVAQRLVTEGTAHIR